MSQIGKDCKRATIVSHPPVKASVGELPEALQAQIEDLSPETIVQLGEDLLDFTQLADMEHWLAQNAIVSLPALVSVDPTNANPRADPQTTRTIS